ncbi:MAG: hypothetical protein K9M75_13185 [Phycisphaerae bacterium]|nr:hypothetical protein [Phycisphaerae bacterium]
MNQMGRAGFEHPNEKSPEVFQGKEVSDTTLNYSTIAMVQNPVHLLQKNPELMQVIENWTDLPEHIRQAILTLVESAAIAVNDQVSK